MPPDRLVLRLDLYHETVLLSEFTDQGATVRMISADAIAAALARDLTFSSGLLPDRALWWQSGREGTRVALWRPAKVWRAALREDPFQPARRFKLPMPGLIFLCQAHRPPAVYAVKRRPGAVSDKIFHAPTFNTFQGGGTCQGTTKYGAVLDAIPEEFFASYFTRAGDGQGRSKKHPRELLALWEELHGTPEYPLEDMVELATIGELMQGKGGMQWR